MYCSNCGTYVEGDASFCPNCGANLRSGSPSTQSQSSNASMSAGTARALGFVVSLALTFFFGIIGIVITIVLGVVIYLAEKDKFSTDVLNSGIIGAVAGLLVGLLAYFVLFVWLLSTIPF